MQQMLSNMMKDAFQNLPPDVLEKLQQASQFIAMVDGRLAAIENDLSVIKAKMGITTDEKRLTHDRINERARDALNDGDIFRPIA
jgi:hypothetical protein